MNLSLFGPNAPVIPHGEAFTLHQGDAVEWLRSIPTESVDLVVTDPAYSSLDKHRAVGTTTRLAKDWFPTVPNEYFEPFFAECFRALKPNTHCYVMCDAETMFAIKPMGEAAGFKFWKPIVWDKLKMGMGYHYRARCEFILFFEKGKRRLNSLGITDVIELEEDAPDIIKHPRMAGGFPTEKPIGLSQVLIAQSSEYGETIIDPFMGSGSTGEAALRLGRRFAGADLQERSVDLTRERLVDWRDSK